MKKIILITLTMFFELFFIRSNFAYVKSTFEKYESSSSTGYSEVTNTVYLNQYMNLQNINVKFTQDDTYYYFKITGNSTVNVYGDVGVANYGERGSDVVPLLYKKENFGDGMVIVENNKMPFADFGSGTLYTTTSVSVLDDDNKTKVLEYRNNSYRLSSSGAISNEVNDRSNNGEKYYIGNKLRYVTGNQYNFKNATTYPIGSVNNGIGFNLIQNSSSSNNTYNDVIVNGLECVDKHSANINVRFSIEKKYIDDYRYICFASSYSVRTLYSLSSNRQKYEGISFCTQTIDLKSYSECDHDWSMNIDSRTHHTMTCKNCEWSITEAHKLEYEYDGIKNDICKCSFVSKVNYHFNINDDYTKEVKKTLDTDSAYEKIEFKKKTGYKFKYYNVYEKQRTSTNLSATNTPIKTVSLGTSTVMRNTTGNTSMIYEAKYDPITFTIKYSNENNKGVKLTGSIADQKVTYDKAAYLKSNIYYEGYIFNGWSRTKGSEKVDFKALQEMTNYISEDGYVLTLYPVYSNFVFKVAYSAGKRRFADGSNYKVIDYSYHDDKDLEIVISDNPMEQMVGYIDDYGNMFYKMSDIKKYLEKNGMLNETLNLFPIFERKPNVDNVEESTDKKPEESTAESTTKSKTESTEESETNNKESEKTSESTAEGTSENPTKNSGGDKDKDRIEESESGSDSGTGQGDNDKKKDGEIKPQENKDQETKAQETKTQETKSNSPTRSYSSGGNNSGGSGGGSSGSGKNLVSQTTIYKTADEMLSSSSTNEVIQMSLVVESESVSEQNVSETVKTLAEGEIANDKKIADESKSDIESEEGNKDKKDEDDKDNNDDENDEVNDNEDTEKDQEDVEKDVIIATMSFIRQNDSGMQKPESKIGELLNFFRNNMILSAVCGTLFVILLVGYEVLIIKHYNVNN